MIRSRKPMMDDGDIIRLIRQELLPLNPPGLRPRYSNRDMTKRMDRGVTFVWVPDKASVSRVCGFVTCIPRDRELFIDMLALDRNTQGRGIGALLLHKAEQLGMARGCSHTRLYVNDRNIRGIRFYQKHGMYTIWHDPTILSYVMEKPIG
jgi:ribosomal protein S18 acetylase RimI-like enzyme